MKLLHVYSGNLFGGVESLLLTLAATGNGGGPEHRFALCFEGRLAEGLRKVSPEAAPTILPEVRFSRPWTVWTARRRLAETLRATRPDACVCHSPWTLAALGPAVRAAGVPLVFWLHDAVEGRHWLERWSAWVRPDLAVCNSAFTRGRLHRLFGGSQDLPAVASAVIYCPVKPTTPPADEERSAVRRELDTPADAVVILQAARLEEWKGHRLHLEALAELATRRDLPPWVCWMAGGPQKSGEEAYLAGLKSLADRAGIADRVRFLGQRRDVPRLMAAADIHCQPNTGPEPFGIVFVEALYSGLPVVTVAMGGAAEIVDGTCGIAVPTPGTPAAVADALARLVGDPELRRRLGSAGPVRAAELCDPDRQAGRLAEAIRPLIRSGRAAG